MEGGVAGSLRPELLMVLTASMVVPLWTYSPGCALVTVDMCRHHRSHSCWSLWARSNYPDAVEEGLIAFPGDPYVRPARKLPSSSNTVSLDEVAWSPVMNHALLPWRRDSLGPCPMPCSQHAAGHMLSGFEPYPERRRLFAPFNVFTIVMISQSVVAWALFRRWWWFFCPLHLGSE